VWDGGLIIVNLDSQLFSEEFHAVLKHPEGVGSRFRGRVQSKVECDHIANGHFAVYPDHLFQIALRVGQPERISDHRVEQVAAVADCYRNWISLTGDKALR
jgi:hypothetical protein